MISPCINVCSIDPQAGTCTGCGRSLAEISAWPGLTDGERQTIINRLAGPDVSHNVLKATA